MHKDNVRSKFWEASLWEANLSIKVFGEPATAYIAISWTKLFPHPSS